MPILGSLGSASARGFGFAGGAAATAPTIGTATATGATTATVSYTAPLYDGGSPITSYTAVSSPGGITGTLNTSASGTITVSGLTSGVTYTFTVYATNAFGNSPSSGASNSITTFAVPGAPTNIVARIYDNLIPTYLYVDYTAPVSDGGSEILSYTSVSTPGNITNTRVGSGSGTIDAYVMQPLTTYTFKVYATNAYGNGPLSNASNSYTTYNYLTNSASPSNITIPSIVNGGQWYYYNVVVTCTSGGPGYVRCNWTTTYNTFQYSIDGSVITVGNPYRYKLISVGNTATFQIGFKPDQTYSMTGTTQDIVFSSCTSFTLSGPTYSNNFVTLTA